MNPAVLILREAYTAGRPMVRNIQLSPRESWALSNLTGRVYKWSGEWQLRLNEADAALYERFKRPSVVPPSTLDELERQLRSELRAIVRTERLIVWPRWTHRFLRKP